MKSFLALVGACLLIASCSGNTTAPTAPPPPPVAACQANNTGEVTFGNRSTSNTTYDIVWDGARLGALSSGQTSPVTTAAAGVPHTLRFQITNTTGLACNQSAPVLIRCTTQSFTCTF